MQPRLLAAITAHGYGHAAQTAEVVAALRRHRPNLDLLLLTDLPVAYLRTRFETPFEHRPYRCDVGMVMHSALAVDADRSREAYVDYHRDWNGRIAEQRELLRQWKPDLILANVPYTLLLAAKAEGIPAVAMCSLNWADVYEHYCVTDQASREIHSGILDAYRTAHAFLRLTPGMPMENLHNRFIVGPVARKGRNRSQNLRRRFRVAENKRLLLAALGGFDTSVRVKPMSESDDIVWLAPANWRLDAAAHITIEETGMAFIDLLASCDAVLSKPGYGTYTEATCHAKPLCHLPRNDWPESPFLNEWLHAHTGRRAAGEGS